MKQIHINLRVCLLLIAILAMAGCGGGSDDTSSGADVAAEATAAEAAVAEEPEALVLKRQIVVIGDSIGAGVNAGVDFPAILQGLTGIPVINTSTPGISAEGGASKARGIIERLRPMYLVVLLGTNNATGAGGGVSGAISSLRYVARIAADYGVIAVIGTLPPITRDATENSNASAISGGIAGIGGARIARVDSVVSTSDISDDGLHPAASGQSRIAEAFAAQIY